VLIEVAETHPPLAGRKLAKVKARTGEEFNIWPDKLSALNVGQRYEVEIEENEFQGRTYRKIIKVTPVAAAIVTNGAAPARVPAQQEGEQAFVTAALTALIRAGEIKNDKAALWNATQLLRQLWQHSFGDRGTFTASEAAQPRQARG
jgi:hypothetical protein